METQEIIAIGIVAITAGIFIFTVVKRFRTGKKGCGTSCGCAKSSPLPKNNEK